MSSRPLLSRLTGPVPARWRRSIRRVRREFSCRLRDAVPDLAESILPRDCPLPPAFLRERVSRNSDRREFLEVGRAGAAAIAEAFEQTRAALEQYPRWLDFGCGPGRFSRHLLHLSEVKELWGVDVDSQAISWNRRHLEGQFHQIGENPPTGLPTGIFDAVVVVSVFTHLSELRQAAWLHELHRLMRPGGLLIATTHAPALTYSRPDINAAQQLELRDRGFLFAAGNQGFNEDSAFHSREYLLKTWGALMGLLLFRDYGMARYQDLSVWVKW